MKAKFVVGLDGVKDEKPFNDYIKEHGYAWWHWIGGFWMIVDYDGELTCAKLRDDLNVMFPYVSKMVLEVPPESSLWAGFGPNNESKNMFTWIEENW